MKKHLLLAAMAMVMGVASAAADEVTLTKTDGSASGLVWTSTTSPVTTITRRGGAVSYNHL
ncbi:MAG: hypothetical protein K2F82_07455, partial [Muribaculaceae bacterium]|nr:hypothetical protein [Muribaculaceae bacterium]